MGVSEIEEFNNADIHFVLAELSPSIESRKNKK